MTRQDSPPLPTRMESLLRDILNNRHGAMQEARDYLARIDSARLAGCREADKAEGMESPFIGQYWPTK